MRTTANFGFARERALWAAGLVLVLGLYVGAQLRLHTSSREPRESEKAQSFAPCGKTSTFAPPQSAFNGHFEVKRYIMDFDGDHSLDVATVVEQVFAGSSRYVVQLHLASGAEQSVVVTAPPGGLQIEMHDMTGDKVPNDLILRPALLRWFPTVLVNDGHDHFAVAISGTDPGSFSSSEDLGSQRRDSQIFAVLISSGFKATALPIRAASFGSKYRQGFSPAFTQTFTKRLGNASSSGRAPPFVTAI
jgi:hypothetical protein